MGELGALSTEGPAHVANAYEERCGHAVEGTDFAAEEGGFTAETHGADTEFIGGLEDILFEGVEFVNGVTIL